MVSPSPSAIRNILGIIGNVISFAMFLAPCDTMFKIIKSKDVQEFSVIPYMATVLNCAMWVIYGLPNVNPDHILVVTINGIGLGLEFIYVAIFFIYSTGWSDTRKKITYGGIGEIVFTLAVLATTFFGFHTTHNRTIFMGVLCLVFNLGMYVSPLTAVKNVIKTKSVEYMPFWLNVANLLNGACWTAYACIHFDIWMVIPNGLGAVSNLIQLILYVYYYKKGGDGGGSNAKLPVTRKEIELEAQV